MVIVAAPQLVVVAALDPLEDPEPIEKPAGLPGFRARPGWSCAWVDFVPAEKNLATAGGAPAAGVKVHGEGARWRRS
ncbi:hypothetical protein QFZ23_004707 [Arthrobacter globiformis]|uniref:hypothetical protein n=1 Tax=Arthrobacter globiformis TaxID=1665 RepID=UPI0027846C4B|nr:hypothetical protein [Arthrobacter globiformis]MDQ1060742.1 hypothetical protein [Arthrobacter globiformis]